MFVTKLTPELIVRTRGTAPQHAGQGHTRTHFGEILQGSFLDRDGAVTRGLTTLRCHLFQSWARFVPTDAVEITVTPAGCEKARRTAENTLAYLGFSGGGHLTLVSDVPYGIGAGSSTADVVATIQAVANACEADLGLMEITHLAVEAEIAVDPIMFRPCPEVLFAHRNGTILENFSTWLPQLRVLGVTDGKAVDTLAQSPARYTRSQVDEFEFLRALLREAITNKDRTLVGRVATRSAIINQAYLPKPSLPILLDIALESRSLGLSVSHSGSAVALLFDPRVEESNQQVQHARNLLKEVGFGSTNCWSFMTGWPS